MRVLYPMVDHLNRLVCDEEDKFKKSSSVDSWINSKKKLVTSTTPSSMTNIYPLDFESLLKLMAMKR